MAVFLNQRTVGPITILEFGEQRMSLNFETRSSTLSRELGY
jgi:hypothetical protein